MVQENLFDPAKLGRASLPSIPANPNIDLLSEKLPTAATIKELGYKHTLITPEVAVLSVSVTLYKQHARIIYNVNSREAVLVDPGGDADKIIGLIGKFNLTPKEMWLTHSHLDHCGGVRDIKSVFDIPLLAHPDKFEKTCRRAAAKANIMTGIKDPTVKVCPEPDIYISGGEKLNAAGLLFEAIHTPGHAPGHLCFYNPDSKVLISGDLAFQRGLAPTFMRGTSKELLTESLRQLLERLPANTIVMPGHQRDMQLHEWKQFVS